MPDANATESQRIASLIHELNQTWIERRPDDMAEFLHVDVVMVLPGFAGQTVGREAMIAGFKDFCENAELGEHKETDLQINTVGNTGVASFRFDMVYRRQDRKYRATGRDVWVFSKETDGWQAVWRTMLDMQEDEVI